MYQLNAVYRPAVGIDVGATALHCVSLTEGGAVLDVTTFGAGELDRLVAWAEGAGAIAVDAPDRLSIGAHLDDPDPGLGRKFRSGRCAEVELGRRYRIWVPWVTPIRDPAGWMVTGLAVYEALRSCGHEPIEVYPHAAFRTLAGGPLPRKSTLAGRRARIELLEAAGIREPTLDGWSHDSLDALVGAVVARDRVRGVAVRVGCEHDGSAIWLPA